MYATATKMTVVFTVHRYSDQPNAHGARNDWAWVPLRQRVTLCAQVNDRDNFIGLDSFINKLFLAIASAHITHVSPTRTIIVECCHIYGARFSPDNVTIHHQLS